MSGDGVISPGRCLVAYGQAWFEADPDRRLEHLRTCCTEDIVFMDTQLGRFHGLAEVSAMIGRFIAERPTDASRPADEATERGRTGGGVGVEVVTDLDVHHRFFRYSFVWTFPDGNRSGGTDVGEFAEDGRMRLITVWPATDQFPLPAGA